MRSTVAIIASCVLLLTCLSFQSGFCSSNSDKPFDYFILSREWPFSFCSIEKCKNEEHLPNDFNIHGLWPQGNDGSKPAFCPAKFNETQLAPLNATLLKSWLDLKNPIDYPEDFWHEEYRKHGSCAASDPEYDSTYKYFAAALNVSLTWPIMPMLKSHGITPGNRLVNVADISNAVKHEFGFSPSVRCVKKSNSDDSLLYEIRICVDKHLKPRQCNTEIKERNDNHDADLKPVVDAGSDDNEDNADNALVFKQEIENRNYRYHLEMMNTLGSRLMTKLFQMQQMIEPLKNFAKKKFTEGSFECPADAAIRIPEQPV